jgi:nitronate monooxygenase
VPWHRTRFSARFGLDVPIVQAPMAGGMVGPALVGAVSDAGGLGSLAFGMTAPDAIGVEVAKVLAATNRPFAANVFLHEPGVPTADQLARSAAFLAPIRAELGLPPQGSEAPGPSHRVADQVAAVLEAAPPVVSFAFGAPKADVMAECRRRGILTIATATTPEEARHLEALGVDAICAQGAEAGGHRGTFLHPFEAGMIGTLALVRACVDAVDVPVIAAGGIMDGRSIAAALLLGAEGVQLGTAFLLCPEATTARPYRRALAAGGATAVTRAISGRPARGIENRIIAEGRAVEADLPPYPVQNELTKAIRAAAAAQDRPEFLSLWAGQGVGLVRDGVKAADLVARLAVETEAALLGALR